MRIIHIAAGGGEGVEEREGRGTDEYFPHCFDDE